MNKSVLKTNSQYMYVYVLVGSLCIDVCGIYIVYDLSFAFIKIIDLILVTNWCVLKIIHSHLYE